MQEISPLIIKKINLENIKFPWRSTLEKATEKTLFLISLFPMILVLIIIIALAYRAQPILTHTSIWNLITGRIWKPLQGDFGFLPFIIGTLMVTGFSLALAVPPSLFTAIYLAEYANPSLRAFMKPLLDLLAAIPSVVYGIWGVIAIVPMIQNHLLPFINQHFLSIPVLASRNPTGYGIFAGGVVLAVMIAPFIVNITFEVMNSVPDCYREASLALGSTRWQMVKSALIPQVIPGILAGIVLGASRAIGETMAVLMVVGNVAQIPKSIFDAAYPLPALIANNYGEMMSIPLYDSALLGAALILLLIILLFNILSTMFLYQFKRRM